MCPPAMMFVVAPVTCAPLTRQMSPLLAKLVGTVMPSSVRHLVVLSW